MKKHLIIALSSAGELLQFAGRLAYIQKKFPRDLFEILTFKSHQKIAESLPGISNIHTINCQQISGFIDSNFYSDMHGFNSFIETLTPLFEQEWEQVINCSLNKASSHLCSAFVMRNQSKFSGNRLGSQGNMISSDPWSLIQMAQDMYLGENYISHADIAHYTYRTALAEDIQLLRLNQSQTLKAGQMLSQIRQATSTPCKIVGLPLFSAHHDIDFNFDRIVATVSVLLDDLNYFPILITSSLEKDKVFAKQVSKEFANSLIIIETDNTSLPAVLSNVDAIIGNNGFATRWADILGTPVLRIYLEPSSMLGDLSIQENQQFLIAPPTTAANNLATDIHAALKHLLGEEVALDMVSLSTSLYISKKDNFGIYALQIAGRNLSDFNGQYLLGRTFLSHYTNNPVKLSHTLEVLGMETNALRLWAESERQYITLASRDLLGALRSLLRTQKDRHFVREFVQSLDKLFAHGDKQNLSSLACNLFKARIDGIEETSFQDNIQRMEKALYQLKDDLQLSIGLVKNIEENAQERSKQSRLQSVQQRTSIQG